MNNNDVNFMLAMMIVTLLVVMALIVIFHLTNAKLLRPRTRRFEHPYWSKSFISHGHSSELERTAAEVSKWRRFHPLGALTLEESVEFQALLVKYRALLARQHGAKSVLPQEDDFDDNEGEDWKNN